MTVATYEGIVEGGQIRLPDGVSLPEHAAVYVIVPSAAHATEEVFEVVLPEPPIQMLSPRLRYPEQASRFVMEVREVPDADLR